VYQSFQIFFFQFIKKKEKEIQERHTWRSQTGNLRICLQHYKFFQRLQCKSYEGRDAFYGQTKREGKFLTANYI